jgi:tripartite-type tricarboxylate transporter receptor subunit TctC
MAATAALSSPVAAQDPITDFYKGKQINLILSAGEGGGYSSYARAFAPYFSNHIPGKPTIVVQNMPGGGGIRAMNYLFSQASKDGSTLGFPHSSVVFAPIYGQKAAQFDARQANWLGSLSATSGMCVAWHDSPITTWEDLKTKEFVVGGTGAGSQMETLPTMINRLFGTKIKIISGYKGGNDVYLAMERGEVQGRCGGLFASINSTRPDWFPQKKVRVPVQIALKRNPDLPDAPALGELTTDKRILQVLELVLAPDQIDRPYFVPPSVPAERVAALRKAFKDAMADPGFIEDAKKQKLDIEYVSGEQVAAVIERAYALPADVVAEAKLAVGAAQGGE